MRFATVINGERYLCDVVAFTNSKELPSILGEGFHSIGFPMPVKLAFRIYHFDGTPAPEIQYNLTIKDMERLYEDFIVYRGSEDYGFYDHCQAESVS